MTFHLRRSERRWLQRHPYFGDPTHDVWQGLNDAFLGASVFLRLADLPSNVLD
jgi:hypothetical protein